VLEKRVPHKKIFRFLFGPDACVVWTDPAETLVDVVMIAGEVISSRPWVTIFTSTIAATASSHVETPFPSSSCRYSIKIQLIEW